MLLQALRENVIANDAIMTSNVARNTPGNFTNVTYTVYRHTDLAGPYDLRTGGSCFSMPDLDVAVDTCHTSHSQYCCVDDTASTVVCQSPFHSNGELH